MTELDDSVPVAAPPSRDLSALAMKAQVAAAIFGEDAAPVKVGRYEVLETLGVGGMGVVYAAWDESLGRRVALKLLPTDQMGSDRERARLAREAQALARLSHPNVVTVYEAGEHEHGVFVAMELVEGVSLQKWQQQRARTRRELVEVYLQAGRGLTAAHRAGLVHRDFKPANVLVGNDGRVRVVDFGLAQGPGLAAPTTSGTGRRLSAAPISPVTRTGALVGTPAYMAPEQLAGTEADARADQFSFCVALYEALTGCRPYEIGVLRTASERNVPPPTKGSRRLPLLLHRALRRGLAIEPPRRWPDMDALLRAIDADAAWRRRLWGVSGPVVLGLGVAWLAGRSETEAPEAGTAPAEEACEPPDHGPAIEWAARGSAIQRAFEATGKASWPTLWQLVDRRLGEHARQWSDAYVEACRVDDSERSRRITECLERQAVLFEAVLDELGSVDANSMFNAGIVADILAPVEACRNPMASATSETSTAPAELLQRLNRALVREALGKYSEAEAELADLLEEQSVDSPLGAEIALRRGEVLAELGRRKEAEGALVKAQAIAGSDERLARVVLAQIELFAAQERPELVELLSHLFEELAQRLVRPSTAYADYLDARGLVATTPKAAEGLHRRSLAERYELGRTDLDGDVIETKLRLANALADGDEHAKAREAYEEVKRALEATVGTQHPQYAKVLFDLGLLAKDDEDLEKARELFAACAKIEEEAYGPASTQLARTEVEAAMTELVLGDQDRALSLAEHAWSVQSKLPDGHSDRIAALRALATIELSLGHNARSLELHRLLAKDAGTEDVPEVLHNIAWLQCQVGECLKSGRFVDQARVQIEARLLGEHDSSDEILRLYVLHTSAVVALAEGEREKARVLLAEVLRDAPSYEGTDELIAEATRGMQRAQRRR